MVINVTATGLKTGSFPLIKYTGTALPNLANFQLSTPPGVAATLVNNTGNHSIDLQITQIPNQLSWYGTAGGNWDLTSVNWKIVGLGTDTIFRQYTNGSIIAGDAVLFDDSLTNDFVNPQPRYHAERDLLRIPGASEQFAAVHDRRDRRHCRGDVAGEIRQRLAVVADQQ